MTKRCITLLLVLVLMFVAGCSTTKDKVKSSKTKTPTVSSEKEDNVSSKTDNAELNSDSDSDSDSDTTGTAVSEDDYFAKTDSSVKKTSNTPSKTEPAKKTDKKVSVAKRLCRGINFSSTLESPSGAINYDEWIYDDKYYQLVASEGFDHIRVPVNFGIIASNEAPYEIDKRLLRALDIVVRNALNNDLMVVIDFHNWTGYLYENQDVTWPKFYSVWEQVATRFRNYPEEVIFELLNEPNTPFTVKQLNQLQLETIKRIRKTNPTRTIALASNENNGNWVMWETQFPEGDENCIISIHDYTTMNFTHQGADWGGLNFDGNQLFTEELKQNITNSLQVCADYERRTGREVWISEWGVFQGNAIEEEVAKYIDYFSSECKRLGLANAYWEFNSGYGLFDYQADQWKPNLINSLH